MSALVIGARVTRYGKPHLGVGTVVEMTEGPRPLYVVRWDAAPDWCGFHRRSSLRSERYAARNIPRETGADLFFNDRKKAAGDG